jgi:hypothetical protein
VLAEDHAVVLKIWAKRHRDLARARNQAACLLHAVLCDLVPGGIRKEISAGQAARILEQVRPADAVIKARCELAAEFLTDLRHLDTQLRDTDKKLAAAVRASGTSLTGIFGVGPPSRWGEAGCKSIVAQRCKLSGMRWTVSGATGILTLRCLEASDRWEEIPALHSKTPAA